MRTILRDFQDGIEAYSTAWRLIRELKLWIYLLIPGVISIIYGVALFGLAMSYVEPMAEWLVDRYPWDFGRDFIDSASVYLGWLLVATIGVILYKYVILIVVAPFMSPLSEKVENYLNHGTSEGSFDIARMFKEILRGIRVALRNIIREIFFTIVLFLLGFVPLIGLISAPAIFILQAYYAGFGNMDYTLERHMGVRDSVHFVRDYKGLAIANGGVFLFILMIPVIGLFVAPGLATVAGAIETVERLSHEDRRPA